MFPVVIPLANFRLFTAAVLRDRVPFSHNRILAEFSSLVESFVLAPKIYFVSVGAFALEWRSGAILPTHLPSYNPFQPFHNISFITELPTDHCGKGKDILRMCDQEELDRKFDERFGVEPRSNFALWTYLSTYVQAYNGSFGAVAVKEYPLVKDLIPDVVFFTGSSETVKKDSLVTQAYNLLKTNFEEKLSGLEIQNPCPIVIPPISAILLDRLPDNCTDPNLIVDELVGLRDELAKVRERFNEVEETLFSDDASLKDFYEANTMVTEASNIYLRKGEYSADKTGIRFFIDNLSFIYRLLIKMDVEPEEMLSLVSKYVPGIKEKVSVTAPSILFDLAVKTEHIKGYPSLAKRKLGINIS